MFHLSFPDLVKHEKLSQMKQLPVTSYFPFPDVVSTMDAMSSSWTFYFNGPALPYHSAVLGLVLGVKVT